MRDRVSLERGKKSTGGDTAVGGRGVGKTSVKGVATSTKGKVSSKTEDALIKDISTNESGMSLEEFYKKCDESGITVERLLKKLDWLIDSKKTVKNRFGDVLYEEDLGVQLKAVMAGLNLRRVMDKDGSGSGDVNISLGIVMNQATEAMRRVMKEEGDGL